MAAQSACLSVYLIGLTSLLQKCHGYAEWKLLSGCNVIGWIPACLLSFIKINSSLEREFPLIYWTCLTFTLTVLQTHCFRLQRVIRDHSHLNSLECFLWCSTLIKLFRLQVRKGHPLPKYIVLDFPTAPNAIWWSDAILRSSPIKLFIFTSLPLSLTPIWPNFLGTVCLSFIYPPLYQTCQPGECF